MFTHLMRRSTSPVLAGLGLCAGLLALHTGCISKDNGYAQSAPNISVFTTGTYVSGVFTPTPAGTTLSIPVGGSAWFRANYSTNKGTAVVNPGNIPVTSNVPFQITNITTTTTYTLAVTSGDGKQASYPMQVIVLTPPSALHYGAETATYYKDVQISPNLPTVAGGGVYTYSVSPALPAGLAIAASTGAITGTPQAPTAGATYTVTAKDSANQSTTCALSLTVAATPLSFSLNPNAIAPGGSSTLSWDANQAAGVFSSVTITASPADASLPATFALADAAIVNPATTTNYTIHALPASGGAEVTRTIGLTVGNAPVALTSFTATPEITPYGSTSDLSWAYTGVPLVLTLDGNDVLGQSGVTVHPVKRQTYTLSGSNILNGTPSVLTKTVVAQGQDLLTGSPLAGGWLDGTGSAAHMTFNTAPISSTTAGNMNLSLDASGNLYIADALNQVVRMATPAGVVTTLAGKPGVAFISAAADGTGSGNGSAARFNRPAQVIASDASTLYEIDYGTHSLRQLTKQPDNTWTVSLLAGTPGTFGSAVTQNLDNPLSIATYNGKIYIADGFSSSIRICDPALAIGSRLSTLAGGGTGTQFGLLDGTGSAARFRTPSSIAIDPATGDIFVADRETHTIRKVTQGGVVTTLAGAYPTATSGNVDGSGTTARFNKPTGLVRATDGTLYVTDHNNHTIRQLAFNAGTSTWDVTTIAGTGTSGYTEGTGTNIQFSSPEGLALDASGVLYVADAGNYVVRKLTPSGAPATWTSSTFLGTRQAGLVNGTAASARFKQPNGIAFDKNGVAYVADEANKVVRKIATDGSVSTWGSGVTMTAPYSITVDDNLNVYVLDRAATGIVVKIDSTGVMSTVTLGVAVTNASRGLAVTADGTALFVADGNNLRKFDLSNGSNTASITTGLSGVNGIATAADGVYWVEFTPSVVKKANLDLTGAAVIAGTSGTKGFKNATGTGALFNQPVALALAKDGSGNATKVYVLDQGNHAIRAIDRTSGDLVSTVVGTIDTTVTNGLPGVLAALPGTLAPGGTSGLYFPKGIAINNLGDLLVTTSDGIMQVTAP